MSRNALAADHDVRAGCRRVGRDQLDDLVARRVPGDHHPVRLARRTGLRCDPRCRLHVLALGAVERQVDDDQLAVVRHAADGGHHGVVARLGVERRAVPRLEHLAGGELARLLLVLERVHLARRHGEHELLGQPARLHALDPAHRARHHHPAQPAADFDSPAVESTHAEVLELLILGHLLEAGGGFDWLADHRRSDVGSLLVHAKLLFAQRLHVLPLSGPGRWLTPAPIWARFYSRRARPASSVMVVLLLLDLLGHELYTLGEREGPGSVGRGAGEAH